MKLNFLGMVFDTERVVAVVTWGDVLRMQARINADPKPSPYLPATVLLEMMGQQQQSGLRNRVQNVFDRHLAGEAQLANEQAKDGLSN